MADCFIISISAKKRADSLQICYSCGSAITVIVIINNVENVPAGFGMKIFTVGYGGRKPDDFIALLEKHNVQFVVDVRLKPEHAFMGIYAKSKDPHKGIQGLLERAGIQYLWVAELGNMFRDIDDWPEKYRRHLDEKGDLVCLKLYELVTPFCLMCCEKRALGCHRKLIADYLVNRGYEVEHLE